MGILKGLARKRNRHKEEIAQQEEENLDAGQVIMKRENVDMHDKSQRERYINACLEQLAESSKELETLEAEYNIITSKLTDMEEIDAIAPEMKEQLCSIAKNIIDLEQNHNKKKGRKSIMSENEYAHMERISEFMPKGIQKLKDAEEYQVLVKNDLGKLDGEKQAYLYRKNEIENEQRTMKGLTVICLGSMLALFLIMSVISQTLHMDVQLGYIIAVLIAAIAMTLVFVKYGESQRELLRVEKAMNKLILLQNTVKIRYVNNTNLLDYLYMKYEVSDSKNLQKLWNNYEQERKTREEEAQLRQELDNTQANLVKILRKCKIQDPYIWLHQAAAIYDNKEMVELRHGLIIQRQKLRKQMEYNAKMAQDAQDEIRDVVENYPEYAQKILDMVADYEAEIA